MAPMKIVNVKIKDLIQAEYNPRKLSTEQYEHIKSSLIRFGIVDPVIVNKHPDRNNVIVGGHQRTKVWKDLGNDEIPVYYVDLPIEKEKELNIRLNKNTGEFDIELLNDFFDKDDLLDWGFEDFELELPEVEELEPEETEGDDDIPEKVEPKTVRGDIYVLGGKHRVMCGDSTMIDDVDKLMDGEKADMVFTDPPYGMNLDADYSGLNWGDRKGKKYDNVIGDCEDFKPELITTIFSLFDYCKEMFLWGADYYYSHIPNFDDGHYMVWDKTLESNGDADSNSEFELLWTKQKHKRIVLHFNWFRFFGLSKQDIKTRKHPTQKPLQVCEPFIEKYSKYKNIIVDLFLGSGSTLIACEKTNRICYGMELDEHYCDVIVNRYVDFCKKNNRDWSVVRNGEDITGEYHG